MNTNIQDVKDFHLKFGVQGPDSPVLLDASTYNYRLRFMQEELQEFVQANYNENLEEAADALIDLVYVVMGTADLMGIDPNCWNDLWNEVQRANMSKERCITANDPRNTRKNSLNIVKPENWEKPELDIILKKHTLIDVQEVNEKLI